MSSSVKPKYRPSLSDRAGEFALSREEDRDDALVPLLSSGPRRTFTVMADCGVGEFLWGKDSDDDSCLVGGNIYSLMHEHYYPADISADLFIDMCHWARKYMQGEPRDWLLPWELDWEAFHQEGLALACRLKQEVGYSADIQYVRPWNDPARKSREATRIL